MGRRHAFTGTRLIVKYVFLFVQVPFTRSINQVVGIFEIEDLLFGRIAHEGGSEHRVCAVEQLGTFRILGDELCRTAVHLGLFKTQDVFGPGNHQVDFDILNVLDILDVVGRDIEGAPRRVHLRETHKVVVKAAIAFFIRGNYIRETCANSLTVVHVKLAETAFYAFGFPDVVRLIVNGPAGNAHTAGNQGLFAIGRLIAHVVAILTAIAFVKANRCREHISSFAKNHFDVARHGTVNRANGLLGLRNRLEGSVLCTLVRVASARRHIESRLGGSHSSPDKSQGAAKSN